MPNELLKLKKIDLDKVCRVCLSDRGHLRSIINTKIPKMMELCASIQVSEGDGLPNKICVSCFRHISKFYLFKKKIERNDRILHYYIKQQKKTKQNDILNMALNDAKIVVDDNSDDLRVEEEMICESNDVPALFLDGPPPLVPLADKRTYMEPIRKQLPDDTPPLIPIKPAAILESTDLKLECNTCGDLFNSVTLLKEHKMNQCQKNNVLQCNICRKEFKEPKKLIGHLKGHMVRKDILCKICNKRYPNPSTFQVHMRTHTGERPFKCQICGKGFVRWAGVVGHMRTHQPNKPFKCDTCNKCFKVASNLERHKVLHSGSLPFCCNYCGKTFSQSDNLQLHIKTYHTNERPFLCYECGKRFVSSNRLNRHMWIHSGYKPYRCKICPKAYSNSSDLKIHERSHTGEKSDEDKSYSCSVCEMRFYHPCRLSRHLKTHEKPYVCTLCPKKFSSDVLLKKHISTKHNINFLDDVLEQDADIFVEYE